MDLKKFLASNTNAIIATFLAFAAAYMTFPNYFEANIYPVPASAELWMSLDPSWMIHLNYAHLQNYTWGTDIAFTYGPLSYLSTKVGWGQNRMDFLLYDLFCFVSFFLIFFLSFKESANKIITAVLIALFCVIFPVWIGSANAVILMAFLVFWIRRSLDRPKPLYYLMQIAILVLAFFVKFNTGLIAIPLFVAGIVYNGIVFRKNTKSLLVIVAALLLPIVLIPVLAERLNVNLSGYVKSGMEMISGYNEVMYFDHELKNRLMALLIIALLATVLLYKSICEKKPGLLKNLVILFVFGTAIFVIYKQGFVRGMETDFFIFSVLLIIVTPDFHSVRHGKLMPFLSMAAALIAFVFIYQSPEIKFSLKEKTNKLYSAGYEAFTPVSGLHLFPNNNQLPVEVKRKIGTATVDVYPWNLQMLLENKLNIAPRPVFQSYTAYTPYLEEMNFKHYNSSKAPDFIIYEAGSIDSRYFLFDEPKLNLAITKNYIVERVFDFENRKLILLQKKKDFKPVKLTKIKEYAILLDTPLVPKYDTYYEVELYSSPIAGLLTILDHAPEVQLDVFSKTANPMSYRTSKKLLQSGLFCGTYIKTTEDFADYIQNKTSDATEPIRYYKFRPANPSLFKDKIKITEYKISQ